MSQNLWKQAMASEREEAPMMHSESARPIWKKAMCGQ